jgi:tetratricopeptide (TPR) repeat protein
MFFTNAKRYEEAENSLKEAIRFYDALPDATDRDRLEATRALNVLANTYFFRGAYSKMLETDRTAKDRFEQLYRQNPSDPDFMGAYAMSLDNFGIALEKEAKYDESIGYHLKGLELYRTLAESHPVDYRLRYARCHHNTACGYELIADYTQAEMHFKEAIRIREEERLLNPTAVEPLLSGSYWCLGNLYRRTFKYKKTVEPYTTAYRMRAVMRRRSPVYSPELYTIYEELKNIYVQMNMTEERISLTYEYAMFLSTIDDRTDRESHRVVGYVTEISRELIAAQRAKEALSLLQKATAAKLPDPFAVFSFLSLTVTACTALGKHETANLYRKKLNLENGTKEKMPQ